MGGSPYPCQVRVRVKVPYKPAQLSNFAGIRGLFQEGSTTRLNEQLTQRMVCVRRHHRKCLCVKNWWGKQC